MSSQGLGKVYGDGETIFCQGDSGDYMLVIQEGRVEVIDTGEGSEVQLAIREEGEFIGEMAIFDSEVRSATVRALGKARVLTIDRRNLMGRIHEDPSLAFRLIQTLSRRVRELSSEVARLKRTV